MLYKVKSNSNHCMFSELPSASTRVRHARAAHPLEFDVSRCITSHLLGLSCLFRFECAGSGSKVLSCRFSRKVFRFPLGHVLLVLIIIIVCVRNGLLMQFNKHVLFSTP